MERRFYAEYAQVEATHWWFRGRHAILQALLPQILPPDDRPRILDVGCGTGHMLEFYEPYGEVLGLDIAAEALAFAREHGDPHLLRGSGDAIPLVRESFDLVSMLDIVEHVDDDAAVIAEGARCVRPGGALLVAVPAFQFLWGNQDTINHHKKRYRLRELTALVERAGLSIERATYCNTLLFPPIAAVRLLRRLVPAREATAVTSDFEMTTPGVTNDLLAALFALEAIPLRSWNLPFGVTALVVGRKPGGAYA